MEISIKLQFCCIVASLVGVFLWLFLHFHLHRHLHRHLPAMTTVRFLFLAAVCANKYGDNKKCKGNCRVKQIKLIEFQSTRNCSNNKKKGSETKPQGEEKCINSANETKSQRKCNLIVNAKIEGVFRCAATN